MNYSITINAVVKARVAQQLGPFETSSTSRVVKRTAEGVKDGEKQRKTEEKIKTSCTRKMNARIEKRVKVKKTEENYSRYKSRSFEYCQKYTYKQSNFIRYLIVDNQFFYCAKF